MKQKTKKSFLSRAIFAGFLCGGMFVMNSAWAQEIVSPDNVVQKLANTSGELSLKIETSNNNNIGTVTRSAEGNVTMTSGWEGIEAKFQAANWATCVVFENQPLEVAGKLTISAAGQAVNAYTNGYNIAISAQAIDFTANNACVVQVYDGSDGNTIGISFVDSFVGTGNGETNGLRVGYNHGCTNNTITVTGGNQGKTGTFTLTTGENAIWASDNGTDDTSDETISLIQVKAGDVTVTSNGTSTDDDRHSARGNAVLADGSDTKVVIDATGAVNLTGQTNGVMAGRSIGGKYSDGVDGGIVEVSGKNVTVTGDNSADKTTLTNEGHAESVGNAIVASGAGAQVTVDATESITLEGSNHSIYAKDGGSVTLDSKTVDVTGAIAIGSGSTLTIGDAEAKATAEKTMLNVDQKITSNGTLNLYNVNVSLEAPLSEAAITGNGVLKIKGSVFKDVSTSGAINLIGSIEIEDSKFINSVSGIGSSAIRLQQSNDNKGVTLKGANSFEGNENLTGWGGAILNYYTTIEFAAGSETTFSGNKAQSHGGAIANGGIVGTSTITFKNGSTTEFIDNITGYRGGAIVNAGSSVHNDIVFEAGSKVLFAGNKAQNGYLGQSTDKLNGGGAIFNRTNAIINFGGNAVFVNNKVVGKDGNSTNNDILNEYEDSKYGTITFLDGSKTFFGGGITTLESGGVVNINSGAEVTFGGTLNMDGYGFTEDSYNTYDGEYSNVYVNQNLTNAGTLNINNATVEAKLTSTGTLSLTNTNVNYTYDTDDSAYIKTMLVSGAGASATFDGDITITLNRSNANGDGWSYALDVGDKTNASTATFKGEDVNISVTSDGNYSNQVVTARAGSTITFANTGATNITSTSTATDGKENYGGIALLASGTVVFGTDGVLNANQNVTIKTTRTDGVSDANLVGIYGQPGTSSIVVNKSVNKFDVVVEGVADDDEFKSSFDTEGTVGIYLAGSGDTGKSTAEKPTLKVDSAYFDVTVKADTEVAAVSDGSRTVYGIRSNSGSVVTVGSATTTNVSVTNTSNAAHTAIGIEAGVHKGKNSGYNSIGGTISILGDTTISAVGGKGTTAVYAHDDGSITLGTAKKGEVAGKTVSITGGVYATSGGDIDINGGAVSLTGETYIANFSAANRPAVVAAQGTTKSTIDINATTLNITDSDLTGSWAHLIFAGEKAEINVTADNIVLQASGKTSDTYVSAIRAYTYDYDHTTTCGKITLNGGSLSISGVNIEGIRAQSCSVLTGTDYNDRSTVDVNTDETNITITGDGGAGIVAMSNGYVDINSKKLTISATDVIVARGLAKVNINTDGSHTTVLNGNIDYDYEINYGKSSKILKTFHSRFG